MLDKLGDFKMLELLGEGGMGAVYRARQESLARDVAVKILPERLTRSPRFVQRFYREARSAAGLVHPNVVQIYSIGQDEDRGLHYYAMEYVRGKDLSQILKGGASFSPEQALTIVMQAAEALAVAAEAGIIHRDIKPANIMLTPKGQVKIMDFGLAKMAAGDSMDVTEAGTVIGTANYMSPEQAQGKPLDFRTDLYSLGAVFYELLTGRPPFKAEEPSAVIYMHVYEQPKRPGELNRGIAPAVDRLVLRMLAKRPEERFASPTDLLLELRKLKRELARPAESAPARHEERGARHEEPRLKPPAPSLKPAKAAAAPPPGRRTIEERARAGSVLVCDPSEYARRLYRTALAADYAVAATGTGRECLELMAAGRPDLLILDLALRDMSGFAVLDQLRLAGQRVPLLAVTADSGRETLDRLGRYEIADVAVKPVNSRDLKARVDRILSAAKARPAAGGKLASEAFVQRAAQEEAAESARLTLSALAELLLERQNPRDADLFARRIRSGSPNQVIGVIREMFGRFSEEQAWSLGIYAFKEGDHRVRILAAELVRGRFAPKKAAELLTRFTADADYRVRIAALRELAESRAPGASEFLGRFLADESWKVRREAARGLEALAAGQPTEALVSYYARNAIPPPLYLQRAVKAPNPTEAVKVLEAAAAAGSVRVKEYVAGLLAQASSKVVIPALLKMLGDAHPAVRAAAGRALAAFPTDKVKARLFEALTDDRSGVQQAVAETLGSFHLQRASQALVRLFSSSGKRVPLAAAEFIARCDAAPNAFEQALLGLDAQDEPARGVLALVLKKLFESDAEMAAAVARLRSADRSEAAAAASETADRLAKFLLAAQG